MNSDDISTENGLGVDDSEKQFIPVVRSGAWADIGFRPSMEDVYLCVDNFMHDYGLENVIDGPSAFYGVCIFSLLFLNLHIAIFRTTMVQILSWSNIICFLWCCLPPPSCSHQSKIFNFYCLKSSVMRSLETLEVIIWAV